MNDENRELLSAYIDGALPDAERKELEARIAASSELRQELDEMRAVAAAVRGLPKEPLPPGFMVRFQARRARGDAPRADWVFLPPAARPVAFALSCAVVAFVVWNKTSAPSEEALMHPPGAALVSDRKDAPVSQLDLADRVSGNAESSAASPAKALEIAGAASEPARRGDVLPMVGASGLAAPAAAPAAAPPADAGDASAKKEYAVRRARARAAGSPIGGEGGGGVAAERGASAMTEEERSARNEQMFGFIESEKKKMGIAKVLDRSGTTAGALHGMMAAPAAPKIDAATPSLLKKTSQSVPTPVPAESAADRTAAGPGRLSPDAGLVFTDARSLASSWVLLGFPGEPPAVDFASGRLVLLKPSATKILSVESKPNSVDVTYRALSPEETPDPARDRVAPIPSEPRTVLLFDATPR